MDGMGPGSKPGHPRIDLTRALLAHLRPALPPPVPAVRAMLPDIDIAKAARMDEGCGAAIVSVGSFRASFEYQPILPIEARVDICAIRVDADREATGWHDVRVARIHEIGEAVYSAMGGFVGSQAWDAFAPGRFSEGKVVLDDDSLRTWEGGDPSEGGGGRIGPIPCLDMAYRLLLAKA